jgi:hypothetical protein
MCDLSIVTNYRNNSNFSGLVKMIVALSFIPIPDFDLTIESLSEKFMDILYPLLDCFENNYVGMVNRNMRRRRIALFPPEIWNVHEWFLNEKNRTNYYAEDANRRLNV